MSSNPGDLTPVIGRAFDSARRLPQVCPTGRLFLMRRRTGGYGWEPIPLVSVEDSMLSSPIGELKRGWLPQAALGRGPFKVEIAGLDPFTIEVSKLTQGFGYMQSSAELAAVIYQIIPELTIVPTLASQRRWGYTAVITDEPLFAPTVLLPLDSPLEAALG